MPGEVGQNQASHSNQGQVSQCWVGDSGAQTIKPLARSSSSYPAGRHS